MLEMRIIMHDELLESIGTRYLVVLTSHPLLHSVLSNSRVGPRVHHWMTRLRSLHAKVMI